jgi:hypothetical protein
MTYGTEFHGIADSFGNLGRNRPKERYTFSAKSLIFNGLKIEKPKERYSFSVVCGKPPLYGNPTEGAVQFRPKERYSFDRRSGTASYTYPVIIL